MFFKTFHPILYNTLRALPQAKDVDDVSRNQAQVKKLVDQDKAFSKDTIDRATSISKGLQHFLNQTSTDLRYIDREMNSLVSQELDRGQSILLVDLSYIYLMQMFSHRSPDCRGDQLEGACNRRQ